MHSPPRASEWEGNEADTRASEWEGNEADARASEWEGNEADTPIDRLCRLLLRVHQQNDPQPDLV